jgi:hypothetical protein
MVGIQLRDMTRRTDACICYQNIDWAKLRVDSLCRIFHRVCVTNIGSNGNSAPLNCVNDLVKQILPARHETQPRTARGNLQRQTFSDSGRGAGYHDSLVCPEAGINGHISLDIFHFVICWPPESDSDTKRAISPSQNDK